MVFLSSEEKLSRLNSEKGLNTETEMMLWETTATDYRGDWIETGHSDYATHTEIGNTETKRGKTDSAIFSLYSSGIITQQDHLAITSDRDTATERGEAMVALFNHYAINGRIPDKGNEDEASVLKWEWKPLEKVAKGQPVEFREENVREVMFRPFLSQYVVWHKTFNWSQYRLNDMFAVHSGLDTELELVQAEESKMLTPPRMWRSRVQFASQVSGTLTSTVPSQTHRQTYISTTEQPSASEDTVSQTVISVAGVGSATGFRAIAHLLTPDLGLAEKTQCFPRYRLVPTESLNLGGIFEAEVSTDGNGVLHGQPADEGRVWVDNITDTALRLYRDNYSDDSIVKDDIFFYVYGLLHSEGYRSKYKNDLKKELPRIPMAPDFWSFSVAGRKLADLHCGYDTLEGYPEDKLEFVFSDDHKQTLRGETPTDKKGEPVDTWRCEKKPQWKNDEHTILRLNAHITIKNIPAAAHLYKLAGKSPLEIFASEYYVKRHKETGIENDRNLMFKDNPSELLLRIRQLIQVGMETSQILTELPEEFEDTKGSV